MSNLPPPPPPPEPSAGDAAPEGPSKPLWKRWWVIAIAAVIVLLVIGAIAGGGGDDADAPSATDEGDPSTAPEPSATSATSEDPSVIPGTSNVPDTSAPPPTTVPTTAATSTSEEPTTAPPTTLTDSADAIVGSTLETGSGGLARVNAITPNAAPRNEFLGPDPGFTFTEAEVEICAGEDGQSANPLYWKAFLADNTEADVSFGSELQTVGLAPGGCTRGWVAFSVPDGATVSDIVLTDAILSEIARWSVASSTPVEGPLTPFKTVEAGALGAPLELDAGATAVVRSITANATPSNEFTTVDPGHQLVEIDVELCAGTEPLSVNPLYWLATAQDHYTGGAALGGGTLSSLEVAPGQCAAGTVQIDMLEQSIPAYVILTDPILDEWARWTQ